ncbi:MAG: HD domain-containing protein [Clostridiales bacterium]|nr:HD domain-containing protein [Clostridiales bacterium]
MELTLFVPENPRLARQLRFLLEADQLKGVVRRNYTTLGRRENSAEHSWYAALLAFFLAEYGPQPLDLQKVLAMLLIHDLVEIEAGDTFIYDGEGQRLRRLREEEAARRLFPLLPEDQEGGLWELWREFEEGDTSEALFARAMDRLAPILLNFSNRGGPWKEAGVTRREVGERAKVLERAAPALARYVEELLREAERRGYLKPLEEGEGRG